MRDIKFRAWDGQKMIHELIVDINPEDPTSWLDSSLDGSERNAWRDDGLMQYIDLNDKNGVEIYEGDICSKEYKHCTETGYIKFIEGMFCIYFDEDPDSFAAISGDNLRHEVIGNIYENPDLLSAATVNE